MYISIDIETLGLNKDTDSIVEVGAVFDDGKSDIDQLSVFHTYITYPQSADRHTRDQYTGNVWAMFMHSKSEIFRRIAERDPDYEYTDCYDLGFRFNEWVSTLDHDFENGKIVFAGKNAAGFDLPFLDTQCNFRHVPRHHRVIDVGSMYYNPEHHSVPPSLKECLEYAGIEKDVEHTAVADAMDVVRCIRYQI